MFRFHFNQELSAIEKAVKENNWQAVSTLYNNEEDKNRFILDKKICTQVLRLFSNKCKSSFDGACDYILYAMVNCSITTKREIVEKLRALPELSDKQGLPSDLAIKATDIFTVMCANKCDYTDAYTHVSSGQPIPILLDALQGVFFNTKPTLTLN